jgi:hypothetical protein
MNTRFKVFASYNILQYLCDFIHILIFVTISKMPKKSQIIEYSDPLFRSIIDNKNQVNLREEGG